MKYDICVLGLGYIGLPTASIFATKGLKVFGAIAGSHAAMSLAELDEVSCWSIRLQAMNAGTEAHSPS